MALIPCWLPVFLTLWMPPAVQNLAFSVCATLKPLPHPHSQGQKGLTLLLHAGPLPLLHRKADPPPARRSFRDVGCTSGGPSARSSACPSTSAELRIRPDMEAVDPVAFEAKFLFLWEEQLPLSHHQTKLHAWPQAQPLPQPSHSVCFAESYVRKWSCGE